MKVIAAQFWIECSAIDGQEFLNDLEYYGRTCYKSEARITPDSARKFVAKIIKNGHESVLEHKTITVRIICDRGVSHELVRHRIASYSQESTRWCNYQSNDIQFIEPSFFIGKWEKYQIWRETMDTCEKAYERLIKSGATPQEARSVLPNSLKTEIVITCNLREWRHIFRLRCAKDAHPQMREIMIPLLKNFQILIPVIFDDILVEE